MVWAFIFGLGLRVQVVCRLDWASVSGFDLNLSLSSGLMKDRPSKITWIQNPNKHRKNRCRQNKMFTV